MAFNKNSRRLRIKQGIRRKISGTDSRPRLSVDDLKGHTLAHASSKELGVERNINVEISKEVGKKLAEKATANGVSSVVFDRNGYLFHGNIKALADGAREGGLKF